MDERTLFLDALDYPDPADRATFLARACADSGLRRRVESLLAAYDRADRFLAQPAAGVPLTATLAAPPPAGVAGETVADKYTLVRVLGEGGMGTVWLAHQTDPVKRSVAVKLIKPGMDSKAVLARFEAERQALALMDHPNIAKVLDGGVTDQGRPFFVMELVEGVPVTKFCDDHGLSARARLELFVPVCQAIQHAHQKGVIHRDIKPSNVLVTVYDGRPTPKVIDFGVAKSLTDRLLTDSSLVTGLGAIVGTPLYMAPEQADFNAVDVDTRADVYALGVILYELLTGTTPLEKKRVASAAIGEVCRLIKEEEPTWPSRVGAGERGAGGPDAPRSPPRGPRFAELDWVVMKALAKERDRRYETATALADDVGRFLRDEPVTACPPSAAYRARKFLRRHRGPVAAAVAVVVALVAGIVGTTVGLVRADAARRDEAAQHAAAVAAQKTAEAQRDRAVKAEAEAEANAATAKAEAARATRSATEAAAILKFLEDQILKAPRPVRARTPGGLGTDVTILDAIEAAEPKIAGQFRDQPLTEASIREVIGSTLMWGRRWDKAIPQHARGLELRAAALGDGHPDTVRCRNQLGRCMRRVGWWADAFAMFERSVADRAKANGRGDGPTRREADKLALTYRECGRPELAVPVLEENLRHEAATNSPDRFATMHHLAEALAEAGRWADAWPHVRAAAPALARRGHDDAESAIHLFAEVSVAVGRADEAEPQLREWAAKPEPGPQPAKYHRAVAHGLVLVGGGRYAEAVEVLGVAIDAAPPATRVMGEARSLLGAALSGLGRHDEAEDHLVVGYRRLNTHQTNNPLAPDARRLAAAAADRAVAHFTATGKAGRVRAWQARRAELAREVAWPPRPVK